MRRLAGPLLLALGALALLVSGLVRFSAYPDVVELPADPALAVTATATGATVLDLETLEERQTDLTATTVVRGADGADEGADTVVWEGFLDVVDAQGETVRASAQRVTLDRRSALAVPDTGGTLDGEPVEHEGLVWVFPPGTNRREYALWDAVLGAAAPARPDGESQVEGLDVLRFVQELAPVVTGSVQVPGELVAEDAAAVEAATVYSARRTLLVEPQTGTVVRTEEQQRTALAFDGEDRAVLSEWTLVDDDASVRAAVQRARPTAERRELVGTTAPAVLLLAGLALTAAGALLVARDRSRRYRPHRRRTAPEGSARAAADEDRGPGDQPPA